MPATLHIQIHQVSTSASEATIRGHKVAIDRPQAKGGTDSGPMGGELFLAAIGGCFMSNLLAAAKARALDAAGLHADVTAELGSSFDRFVAVDVRVSADKIEPETLEKLVEIADRACIMMNTLRGKLDITTRIHTASHAAR